jgi:hypothetical protein
MLPQFGPARQPRAVAMQADQDHRRNADQRAVVGPPATQRRINRSAPPPRLKMANLLI